MKTLFLAWHDDYVIGLHGKYENVRTLIGIFDDEHELIERVREFARDHELWEEIAVGDGDIEWKKITWLGSERYTTTIDIQRMDANVLNLFGLRL